MKMMKMLKLSCAAVIAMALGADGAREEDGKREEITVNAFQNGIHKNSRYRKGCVASCCGRKQLR